MLLEIVVLFFCDNDNYGDADRFMSLFFLVSDVITDKNISASTQLCLFLCTCVTSLFLCSL